MTAVSGAAPGGAASGTQTPRTLEGAEGREFRFADADFAFLVDLMRRRAGIVLAPHKKHMVYSRLVRRVRALGMASFHDYCALLARPGGESEVGFAVNALTTNLTRFFREAHHFDHLRDTVLPALRREAPSRRLRVWSAGCSSGEEPYSIAMTMREAMHDLDVWDARILATDLDTETMGRGRRGVYTLEDVASVPEELRTRYVRSLPGEPNHVAMCDNLRRLIAFKYLNLMDQWPMKGQFQVIFCRNVLIYFDRDTQKRLIERFADILAPRGVLYLGHSESLHRLTERFELLGRTIYRKLA